MDQKAGIWQSIHEKLASLKLSVFIFLTLAVCSLIGTLLPQGVGEEEMQRHYGPGLAWWISSLGLDDLYHTNWFRFLLLLLCLNLIICTIERLPKTLKLLQRRDERNTPERLLKFGHHKQLSTRLPWDETKDLLTRTISEDFAPPAQLEEPGVFAAIAEKGRWSRLMVYVIHLSILVILFGALMGSILGFKGSMNIAEGETSGEVELYGRHAHVTLPFQVRCDDFEASFYDTGAPKEYRSDLTIIDKDHEVLKQTIRVNDPMTYDGVTFYQASYGSTLKDADVEFQNTDTNEIYKLTLPFRTTVTIPGTKDRVELVQYEQDLSRFGPAVAIMLMKEGKQEPSGSWILVKMPEFHGNKIDNYKIKVTKAQPTQYTGLQVKRDPGVWVVWFGFTAMIVGIGLTFYTSHRKLWIWASPEKSSNRVIVAGRASKNSIAFEQEFERLCERLQDQLKPESRKAK
jgi:cytochrome c biogenesis protein